MSGAPTPSAGPAEAHVLVTDAGFAAPAPQAYLTPADLAAAPAGGGLAVEIPADADPAGLAAHFDRLALIRITVGAFNDGRGFTLARRLRRLGFTGRIRAAGPLIADQFPLARAAGFDEIEIPGTLAARQPEAQWARPVHGAGSYQARLMRGRRSGG
jgi:uncharacterized protein (DUF934 family)